MASEDVMRQEFEWLRFQPKMASEDVFKQLLQDLQKQLAKKQRFEEAVFSIGSLLRESYPSASPSLQKLFFSAISRVSTILKTRYTAPGFWQAGLELFQLAEGLVSEPSERIHLRSCIVAAQEQLYVPEDQTDALASSQHRPNRGYLFEGHLTVDPEPPQPNWLRMQSFLFSIADPLSTVESAQGHEDESRTAERVNSQSVQQLMENLAGNIDTADFMDIIPEFPEDQSAARRAPPASKEVVAKLPVINLTVDVLEKLGPEAECAICKENFVVGGNMQELPCKHTFHPVCVKPWLDEHNSCPICRHELQTDDHAYEARKEREREAEEERKGAANAVREGEFMYI